MNDERDGGQEIKASPSSPTPFPPTGERGESQENLLRSLEDAREFTLALIADLSDEQMAGIRGLEIINPLLWEIGHVAWFQEFWVLRHALGRPPIREDADSLYNSSAVPHASRWDLPLPDRAGTLAYMRQVLDAVGEEFTRRQPCERERYFLQLALFHEDMHTEAFTITRQTLGQPRPRLPVARVNTPGETGPLPGDVEIPGGEFQLGARPGDGFVFDNEKWAYPVVVKPFAIARAPVTQAEFAGFVEAGGYRRREFWSPQGWAWREKVQAEHPVYWRRGTGGWERRVFDTWLPLAPHRPVVHVGWYEAEAYCRWAGRRLPSEAEWELAAATRHKRRYPWGEEFPTPALANLDASHGDAQDVLIDVAALPAGDSASGCRQMLGNVWEWTADTFGPYPGFTIDPYRDYSQPWFGDHKVLRGGCWVTRGRLIRNTWRNFYRPERRDVWAGFRTCAGPC